MVKRKKSVGYKILIWINFRFFVRVNFILLITGCQSFYGKLNSHNVFSGKLFFTRGQMIVRNIFWGRIFSSNGTYSDRLTEKKSWYSESKRIYRSRQVFSQSFWLTSWIFEIWGECGPGQNFSNKEILSDPKTLRSQHFKTLKNPLITKAPQFPLKHTYPSSKKSSNIFFSFYFMQIQAKVCGKV